MSQPFPGGVPVHILAHVLNLTPRRVQQLASDRIIQPPRGGFYDFAGSVRGYIAFLEKRKADAALASARVRLLKSKADLAEMRRDRMRGEMFPADQVAACWSAGRKLIIQRFGEVPAAVAVAMAGTPAERQALMQQAIDGALTNLSEVEITSRTA